MSELQRSNEGLRGASDWLFYEYWMLKGLCYVMDNRNDIVEIGLFRNAILESLLIHARALVNFFYHETGKKDDVIATDYLDNPEKWREKHKRDPGWFKDLRTRIDKGVAHIS